MLSSFFRKILSLNSKSKMSHSNHKPGLAVFDLDYTLWPFWVDTHVTPPFFMKGPKVVDAHGKVIKYYPDVPEILKFLEAEGIPVAAASRTSEIDGANQLLDLFGWDKYFKFKEIYPGSKLNHFKVFQKQTGLAYTSMIFFDDEERNIHELKKIGVHCVFVKNGISLQMVKDALAEFPKKFNPDA